MNIITLEQMQITCMHLIMIDEIRVFKMLQEKDFFNINQFKDQKVRLFVNEFIKVAEFFAERFEKSEFYGEIVGEIDDSKMYIAKKIHFPNELKTWSDNIKSSQSEDICGRLLIEIQMFCIFPYYCLIHNNYNKNAIIYFINGLLQIYRELGWSELNVSNYHKLFTKRMKEYHSAFSKAKEGIDLMEIGKIAGKNIIGEEQNSLGISEFVLHVVSVLTSFKPIFEKYEIKQ